MMRADLQAVADHIQQRFSGVIDAVVIARGEITVEAPRDQLRAVCQILRDEKPFAFDTLLDICGVDYLHYGMSQWQTEETTATGFSRGVDLRQTDRPISWEKPRFAVVYHLLSLSHNHRLRLRVFALGEPPQVDSVRDIWASADWYEREAFDLFGIVFEGHPDLRRLLTDYGFTGHPFRKDFPLIGELEMRY